MRWLMCWFIGHDLKDLGPSAMQGELWTVHDYVCKRCGYFTNCGNE